jgi:voltage-gated potassium channel
MNGNENEKLRQEKWHDRQQKLFNMVSVGVVDEPLNRMYDILSIVALTLNLTGTFLSTYQSFHMQHAQLLTIIDQVTVLFFAVDYVLRILTAGCLYPKAGSSRRAILKYVFSLAGIIDLLSFLPTYLPFFFPAGVVVFRMFRVARILRLFRINAYYDSLNVITEVLASKKNQLMSSVFIIVLLMLAASLCMYSVENPAQPDVFSNAFSGIWWAASTLLTIGYGDIYPITQVGKLLSIIIAFLGVGMVAIPTGIISAGFVEQYSRLKSLGDFNAEEDILFIEIKLKKDDSWVGKSIKELRLPSGMIIAAVLRGQKTIIPKGRVVFRTGDKIIIGAESMGENTRINLKEVVLNKNHRWVGKKIRDLDISRQTFIVMVKREKRNLIPNGNLSLCEGDQVMLLSKPRELEFINQDLSEYQ